MPGGPGAGAIIANKKGPTKGQIPVFVEDPLGGIAEGVPRGYCERVPPSASRDDTVPADIRRMFDDSDQANALQETAYVFERHRQLLALLVAVQFFVEMLFISVYIIYDENGIFEIEVLYHMRIRFATAHSLYWAFFWADLLYCVAYYALAISAICQNGPSGFRNFAGICVVGICVMLLMAYADKFNVLLLFMRFMAYIYASFLQGLASNMVLAPALQAPGAQLDIAAP